MPSWMRECRFHHFFTSHFVLIFCQTFLLASGGGLFQAAKQCEIMPPRPIARDRYLLAMVQKLPGGEEMDARQMKPTSLEPGGSPEVARLKCARCAPRFRHQGNRYPRQATPRLGTMPITWPH